MLSCHIKADLNEGKSALACGGIGESRATHTPVLTFIPAPTPHEQGLPVSGETLEKKRSKTKAARGEAGGITEVWKHAD